MLKENIEKKEKSGQTEEDITEEMFTTFLLTQLSMDGQAQAHADPGDCPIPPDVLEKLTQLGILSANDAQDGGDEGASGGTLPVNIPFSMHLNDALLYDLLVNISSLCKAGMMKDSVEKFADLNNTLINTIKQTFKLTMDETGSITCEEIGDLEIIEDTVEDIQPVVDESPMDSLDLMDGFARLGRVDDGEDILLPFSQRKRDITRSRSPSPSAKNRRCMRNLTPNLQPS